jgi:hypothetical protein
MGNSMSFFVNEDAIIGTKAADGCDFRHRLESLPSELALVVKQV